MPEVIQWDDNLTENDNVTIKRDAMKDRRFSNIFEGVSLKTYLRPMIILSRSLIPLDVSGLLFAVFSQVLSANRCTLETRELQGSDLDHFECPCIPCHVPFTRSW